MTIAKYKAKTYKAELAFSSVDSTWLNVIAVTINDKLIDSIYNAQNLMLNTPDIWSINIAYALTGQDNICTQYLTVYRDAVYYYAQSGLDAHDNAEYLIPMEIETALVIDLYYRAHELPKLLRECDRLVVMGCRALELKNGTDDTHTETCGDADAQFWSVYCLNAQSDYSDCIGDFPSRGQAQAYVDSIKCLLSVVRLG